MRTVIIVTAAILATSAQAALLPRDACSNGVRVSLCRRIPHDCLTTDDEVCGSGSVSCSGRQCTACSGGRCCTVQGEQNRSQQRLDNRIYLSAPYDSSCSSRVPCVDFSTCAVASSNTAAQTTTSPAPVKTAPKRQKSFADWFRSLFG